jgi:hypothetical protein
MVGEYVLFNAHNYSLTREFAISSFLSYVVTQEVNVTPRVSATR